jgi:hypothetical protein
MGIMTVIAVEFGGEGAETAVDAAVAATGREPTALVFGRDGAPQADSVTKRATTDVRFTAAKIACGEVNGGPSYRPTRSVYSCDSLGRSSAVV